MHHLPVPSWVSCDSRSVLLAVFYPVILFNFLYLCYPYDGVAGLLSISSHQDLLVFNNCCEQGILHILFQVKSVPSGQCRGALPPSGLSLPQGRQWPSSPGVTHSCSARRPQRGGGSFSSSYVSLISMELPPSERVAAGELGPQDVPLAIPGGELPPYRDCWGKRGLQFLPLHPPRLEIPQQGAGGTLSLDLLRVKL